LHPWKSRATPGRGLGNYTEATGTRPWEVDVMTMYLSNRDVRPTGYEPAEFIEPPAFAPPPVHQNPPSPAADDESDETGVS
jgi:hypothetical protein